MLEGILMVIKLHFWCYPGMLWEAGVESIGEQCALSACADTVEEAKKAMVM